MAYSSKLPVAVHIMLCISHFSEKHKVTSNFLAGSLSVNPVIVRNILGQLKSAGLVTVDAGVGGAHLAKEPNDISLLDIFTAVEKNDKTLFGFHDNPNPECPIGRNVHNVLDKRLDEIRDVMCGKMQSITLGQLIEDMENRIEGE